MSTSLPPEAQRAPAHGVSVADFDGDGSEDLFLAQNLFPTEIATMRLDAGVVGENGGRPLRLTVRAVGPSGARIMLLRATVAADNRWHELRVPFSLGQSPLAPERFAIAHRDRTMRSISRAAASASAVLAGGFSCLAY